MMGAKRSGTLLNWLLVIAIFISGSAAVITVVINTSASKAISLEAERSLLIADMQAAVQTESESAAEFVAHLPDMGSEEHTHADGGASVHSPLGEPADLSDHPDVRSASASFNDAARRLLALADSTERSEPIQAAMSAHNSFIGSLQRLNDAVHNQTNAMSLYHGDTQLAEGELTTSIQRLRSLVATGLSDAVDRSAWSHTLLTITLPIGVIGAVIAAFWLTRARKTRFRVEVLEHIVSEKDRFIGTVSHELRTPMAAVIGFTELLADDENLTEADKREYLSHVLTQGNEVSAIVDDLLVTARAEIGDLSVVAVPISLAAQARQVVETLNFSTAPPVVPESTGGAIGDPARVRQIVRNLLTNAVRHGGPDIRIEIEAEDRTSTFKVRDNGDPIPTDDRTRVFEPYTRLNDAQPVTGSIGIGLTVSRQLARLMHGDLVYDHTEGENVFTLTLPATVHAEEPTSAAESAPRRSTATDTTPSHPQPEHTPSSRSKPPVQSRASVRPLA